MELKEINPIKEEIKKKIDLSKELINKIRQLSSKEFNIKIRQANFEFSKVLQIDDIKEFVKHYKALYEEKNNKCYSIFFCDNKNYISDYFMIILDSLSKNLSRFSEANELINCELFNGTERGLKQPQILEIKKIIEQYKNSYNECFQKFRTEYKRRNKEILDIIISYLNTLLLLISKITILGDIIEEAFTNFRASQTYFQKEDTIKEGKYIISDSYRKFLSALEEIDDLFSNIDKFDEGKKNCLKKLNKFKGKLKEIHYTIYNKVNEIRERNNIKLIDTPTFNLELKEVDNITNDCVDLYKKITEAHEILKNGFQSTMEKEKKLRLDILIMLDITSSMEDYINKFKEQYTLMIENLTKECPEALFYVSFIGYKDLNDKELGDDYICIDFTTNYEKIGDIIQKIEPDGGGDIPEDVAGAFELGLKLNWKSNTKIAFLITDSPCHGAQYHDLNQNEKEEIDDYFDENTNERKMEDIIKDFSTKCISLFCLNLSKNTSKMFEKFKEKYEEIKLDSKREFFVEKENFFNKSIIEKIIKLYHE